MMRFWHWLQHELLENKLMRSGYRRLHAQQVEEANKKTRRLAFDLSDAVDDLLAVTDHVERAFKEMDWWNDETDR
jgi:hypothetical protein